MSVLVTGGTGFIGSHTVVELLETGYEVVIIDNLSNSKESVLDSIFRITNKKPIFYKGDIRDSNLLDKIFTENSIDFIIHFAGLKAVEESTRLPLKYYDNNVYGSIILFRAMKKNNIKNIVFSSSATVYGLKNESPLTEDMPTEPINPYGRSKLHIEEILKDIYQSDNSLSIVILRYFNPIGAHPSGLIGENPKDIPNNLMPYILKVAKKELQYLKIFGNDYDTPDGTGIRDYVHVVDLANAHIKALNFIKKNKTNPILEIFNIGNGRGYSVLDLVKTFENKNRIKIPYRIIDRRPGDVAICYSNTSKILNEFNWNPLFSIEDMVKHSWNNKLIKKGGF